MLVHFLTDHEHNAQGFTAKFERAEFSFGNKLTNHNFLNYYRHVTF